MNKQQSIQNILKSIGDALERRINSFMAFYQWAENTTTSANGVDISRYNANSSQFWARIAGDMLDGMAGELEKMKFKVIRK